ncbi:uncharacterized protein RCC_07743 [Ramularia collo-cygni]|uniref:Uncharacterized protein n=1 Tax=Ramularia collo-cygni TaxID=112498 RepID=A0A2D3VAQ3_9PEZI|nr:uncharacterized protein RCC_07743 [Ramularia collo-cygni]CZT21877.1 uncharacterized protein RCC_07743 [Ramularia collo-cygni]
MAAARVFGIAELLEEILLQVALQAVKDRGHTTLEPLTSLAPLHRVDHTFNNAITHSSKLHKAMYTDLNTVSTLVKKFRLRYLLYKMVEITQFTPLEMLFSCLLPRDRYMTRRSGPVNPSQSGVVVDARRGKADDNPWKQLKHFMNSKDCNEDSSWRKVEVSQKDLVDWEKLTFFEVVFRRPAGYWGKNWYVDTMPFDEGGTLGEVFDKYVEIMERKPIEHTDHARACTEPRQGYLAR